MSDSRKYTMSPHDVQRSREQHCSENGVPDKSTICCVLQISAPLVIYAHALQSFKRATIQAARRVHMCIVRFWNSLLSTNNDLLSRVVQAGLRLAESDKKGNEAYQVLTALDHMPNAQQFAAAVCTRAKVNMNDIKGIFREQIIHDWRSPDNLTPQEAHASSRIIRTYHTHFGIPLGSVTGWWDERKRNKKPLLPLSLRQDIPQKLLRSISCLRLSGHNLCMDRCLQVWLSLRQLFAPAQLHLQAVAAM
eukprot:1136236-Pelagomonas_calceolata.AAC.1